MFSLLCSSCCETVLGLTWIQQSIRSGTCFKHKSMNVMFSQAPTKLITPTVRIAQHWLTVSSVHFWRIFYLTPETSNFFTKRNEKQNKLSFSATWQGNVTVINGSVDYVRLDYVAWVRKTTLALRSFFWSIVHPHLFHSSSSPVHPTKYSVSHNGTLSWSL
jgi:hypothetical protein